MKYNLSAITAAKESFKKQYDGPIEWAVVLGSGLSGITKTVKVIKEIPFSDVENIPVPAVAGHGGKFVVAELEGKTIVIVQGRVHCYEGYSAFETTIATAMLGALGCQKIVLTNAAGGVNENFKAGEIMGLTDHINFLGDNPLIGIPDASKFLDLCEAYDKEVLADLTKEFQVEQGVYAAMMGPSYETPAEVKYLRTIGADAVGMSTVPSAIMANYMKMKVVGLSLITNMAAGITGEKLSHEEVLETGRIANERMIAIIRYIMLTF